MLYEYAVDPSLLGDVNNCCTVFDNFKIHQGRLIADVPRQWVRDAFHAIQDIPSHQCQPVMRKTIKENLKKLLDQALCGNRPQLEWDRMRETWLAHAAAHNANHPFSGIISNATATVPAIAYSINELFISSPANWQALPQMSVERNAKCIVDALTPLLGLSKHIILIDRHLYPGTARSLRVLREIIARVPQYNYGRGIKKLIIHSSDHRQDWQVSLEHNVLPHLPAGFEVECRLWPKNTEHDRFVVTDVGGISFGEGLDEKVHDGTDKVLLSLITFDTRKALIAKLSGTPTYIASIIK